jgi:uncharacterized membrane protein
MTWVLALALAPVAASQPHASSLVYGFAGLVYEACAFLCHQLPERSFHLASAQFPVCARCTGIYIGAAITAVAVAVVERLSANPIPANPIRASRARLVFMVALAPTLATLAYEWAVAETPSNWVRFGAGLPLGAGVAILIMSSVRALQIEPVRAA